MELIQNVLNVKGQLVYNFWKLLSVFPDNIEDTTCQDRVYNSFNQAFGNLLVERWTKDWNLYWTQLYEALVDYSAETELQNKYTQLYGLETVLATYLLYVGRGEFFETFMKSGLKKQSQLLDEYLQYDKNGLLILPKIRLPWL